LPDNLPVERVVDPPPCACGKCGSIRLLKLGEVVSKTLECEPRRWKIIEHVREMTSQSRRRRADRVARACRAYPLLPNLPTVHRDPTAWLGM
jgi:transposase